jgi:hypothetical protein
MQHWLCRHVLLQHVTFLGQVLAEEDTSNVTVMLALVSSAAQ